MSLETLLAPKQKVEWDRLPLDVLVEVRIIARFCPPIQIIVFQKEHTLTVMLLLLQIGNFVAKIDGNVASMRATCKDWKAGVASVGTAISPLVR